MKNLNIMLYIANMTTEINKGVEAIATSENIDEARRFANRVKGLIDSILVMTNTLICTENNEITAQLGELTDNFMVNMLQAMCDVATNTGDDESFFKYAKERDTYFN